MHTPSLPIRRTFTVVVAVTAIVLGFTAIQVASAWTADAAPLVASPASAASIESKLADEQARSADLQDRLTAIMTQTDDMAAALQAAQDRIAADAAHAEQLDQRPRNREREAQDTRGHDQEGLGCRADTDGQHGLDGYHCGRHDFTSRRRRGRRR